MCLFGTKDNSPALSPCSSPVSSPVSPPVTMSNNVSSDVSLSPESGIDMLRRHIRSASSKQLLTPSPVERSLQSTPVSTPKLTPKSTPESTPKSSRHSSPFHSAESSLSATPVPSRRNSPYESPILPNIRGLNILQQYTIEYTPKPNIIPYSNTQKNIFTNLSLETS